MKSITKHRIPAILEQWSEEYEVFAPEQRRKGEVILDRFSEADFTLDFGKPSLPPKWAFLPQNESILEIDGGTYRKVPWNRKRILFGVRPCDMAGIGQSASFMERNIADPYFLEKRRSTISIVMACPSPPTETCFCSVTKSGPWAEKRFDLQLFDMGDVILIEEGSEKGAELVAGIGLDEMSPEEANDRIADFKRKALASMEELPEFGDALIRFESDRIDDRIWQSFGDKCIVCGGCVFVCPTCTCFNVTDCESGEDSGTRIRTWDSCLFGGFTQESSGHNPRPDQGRRLKRRHEHKLKLFSREDVKDNLCGCVGCGRCSDYCPVHIGTREVVAAIAAGDYL